MQNSESDFIFFQETDENDECQPVASVSAREASDHAAFLSNSFVICRDEIEKFPILSPEEELQLAQRVRDGDDEAFRRMVCCNLRLVVSVARRCQVYAGPSLTFNDLVQDGAIGLMRAVRKFDHRMGYRFSTYATFWIRQCISRAISDTSRVVRLPIHVLESLQRVEKARVVLTHTLEREPTTSEIANHVGSTLERVQILNEQGQELISLDTLSIGDSDSIKIEDLIEDTNAISPLDCAIERLDKERLSAIVWQAIKELPPRQAEVLSLRFGLEDGKQMTLNEVAMHLSITRERARQIEKEACQRLRSSENLRQLYEK